MTTDAGHCGIRSGIRTTIDDSGAGRLAANLRLIARLDIKAPNLIKGVHLEGLRVVGDPNAHARKYFDQGIDELLYMDSVATLYERNSLTDLIAYTTDNIFVPFAVGGGLRTLEDIERVLRAGADRVAINTAAIRDASLIDRVASRLGNQCLVISIEAKRRAEEASWEAYTDNGREHTGRDVLDWAREAESRGAGELLLTSVDREGTRKGMDCALIAAVARTVSIPVIASGGAGEPAHLVDAAGAGADALAVADLLHFGRYTPAALKRALRDAGYEVREIRDRARG